VNAAFHGESYGWEAQFLERSEILVSCGGFALRELAACWTEAERRAIKKQACGLCGGNLWLCEAHPDQLADHDPTCDDQASLARAVSRRRRPNARAC
jgi:hypothetical protein